MTQKTALLLIQLGTPDSPSTKDVRRYLREFLNDPRVIDLPWLARKILVNGVIVPFRAPKSAEIYQELWQKSGGSSPLLSHTTNVQDQLQKRLQGEVDVYMAMRYQNPSLRTVTEAMKEKNYEHIIILPLFPQYASASSGSAIALATNLISEWWAIPQMSIINQFWDNEGYIDSIVARASDFNLADYDHILFSYHGLPERHVDKVYPGDQLCRDQFCEDEINGTNALCYKATSYATTRELARKLRLTPEQYTVCFQSRLDKEWLTPFSDEVVRELAQKGSQKILVFSPAFVADCLETVIEIGDEYQEILTEHGGKTVQLVPSCNDHPRFLDGLEEIVRQKM
ncbi:ferrochelatase [Halioglobus sp. HI00S01]|uniref:ferrochelatase n=1 Tax=Halioglobus sp. HI00S01 TaxID=1822214 RepID=UPI0007C29D2C|nr:ferrochelatase [Halioglobus sp. HI00S01]KZX58350.1 ferrochelatase [Halioglobus sp. HI00S01]